MTYLRKALPFALLACAFAIPVSALASGIVSGPIGYKLNKCDRDTRIDKNAVVIKSVDGDTIHIQTKGGSYSVRMVGMDTPETHFMGKSQGEWALKAATVLETLLPAGAKVSLEFGSSSCDGYGRVLGHVYKGKTHINAEMVKRGLAVTYCVAPDFQYCDEFARYTESALRNKTGMFSDPKFELPYDFRRRLGNQPQRSFVGNIQTKEVLRPGHQNEVPIADRVFFYGQDAIQAPYHLVEPNQLVE